MVNLLFVRQMSLLLVSAFCAALMVFGLNQADTQASGIVIGSSGTIFLLAVKGLIDWNDDNSKEE